MRYRIEILFDADGDASLEYQKECLLELIDEMNSAAVSAKVLSLEVIGGDI